VVLNPWIYLFRIPAHLQADSESFIGTAIQLFIERAVGVPCQRTVRDDSVGSRLSSIIAQNENHANVTLAMFDALEKKLKKQKK